MDAMKKLTAPKVIALGISLAILTLYLPSPAHSAACATTNLRWASSSNTFYVTGPVTCTLSELKSLSVNAPLDVVDPVNKIWLLKSNLKLEQGAKLVLHGSVTGGDVNEFRLRSNNNSNSTSTIWIRADWGSLDISDTKVTSWDEATNQPDSEYSSYKRSFIHVRSSLDANGITPHESRMDIINSDIGYLGFDAAESYGLVWKVLGPSPSVFDKVNVYGDIKNSHIHNNYFGMYSFGAYGMQITNNEIDHNVKYGLDPHDDSDNLLIENNNSHHNGNHGIICSQRCDHLTIRNNQSHDNVGHGIMLHRNTNQTLVENNNAYNNTDTGFVIFDSHFNTLRNNISTGNNHGLRLSVGSSQNIIENNEIAGNALYGIYFFKGSDTPTSGDGRPKFNSFTGNNIHNNLSYGIYVKQTDNNTFQGNNLIANGKGVYFDNGLTNTFIGNSLNNIAYNYYELKNTSRNTIKDADLYSVKVTDTNSRMDMVDTRNYILNNSKGFPTIAQPTQSLITQTNALTSAVVSYNRLNLAVKPNSNQVSVTPVIWQTSSPYTKQWKETSPVSSTTALHTVGNLAPNTAYIVKVNNVVLTIVTSDSNGIITFNFSNGYVGTLTFDVVAAP